MTIALVAAAVVFALVNGLNTGAALLAVSARLAYLPVALGVTLLTAGVVAAPLLWGTAVATTFATQLVQGDAASTRQGMLVAVIVSIAVIGTLSALRVPSSLTVAMLGAIAGFGWASGSHVDGGVLLKVLAVMALAPIAGAVGAAAFTRLVAPRLGGLDAGRSLRGLHYVAFGLLGAAYGSNDAQKMLAVMAVAGGVVSGPVPVVPWQLAVCAAAFGAGTLLGVVRMSRTVATGVLPARPLDVVSTEFATSAAMFASSTLGASVGAGQTLSGALIGSGMAQGLRRVRWHEVSRIVTAWAATLPTAVGLAVAAGWLLSLG